jgi:hypothetical protein
MLDMQTKADDFIFIFLTQIKVILYCKEENDNKTSHVRPTLNKNTQNEKPKKLRIYDVLVPDYLDMVVGDEYKRAILYKVPWIMMSCSCRQYFDKHLCIV